MELEDSEFFEKLRDLFGENRSGKHWGQGGISPPGGRRSVGHPSLDYHLGRREAHEAARDVAEQRLLCGPGKDLPRWTLEPARILWWRSLPRSEAGQLVQRSAYGLCRGMRRTGPCCSSTATLSDV